jgi:hypothetical protein
MKGFSDAATTVFLLFLSLGIAGGLYALTTSFLTAKPIIVEEVTGYCVNSTAYFVIRNGGNTPLTSASFVCTKTNSGCSGECVVDEVFPPGGAGYVKVYNCPTGTHKFSLSVSSNSLPLVVYCK